MYIRDFDKMSSNESMETTLHTFNNSLPLRLFYVSLVSHEISSLLVVRASERFALEFPMYSSGIKVHLFQTESRLMEFHT